MSKMSKILPATTFSSLLAFAPMVTNSLGQCGPDLLQFLWNFSDHYAQSMFGFSQGENSAPFSASTTQQAAT